MTKIQIRGRDDPKYRDLKERFEGWILHEPTPWGVHAGLMTYMMNYDKLTDADPEKLNNFLSSYCTNSNMLILGLTKLNQRKFASALEVMSFTRNTVVFYGDVVNDEIMDMADKRILYIRAGTTAQDEWYKRFIRSGDQVIFEIGGNSDFNRAAAVCQGGMLVPVYFIPEWKTDAPERTIERSLYVYKYLTHAYRMIDSARRSGVNVHIGVDLRVLMETAKDGDPVFLREKYLHDKYPPIDEQK